MKISVLAACILAAALGFGPLLASEKKMTDDEKIEVLRGLMAEYAKARVMLPRTRHYLPVDSNGKWSKDQWADVKVELGPAARPGDTVQITRVNFESDKIVLEINGGLKDKSWKHHVQIGMNGSTQPLTQTDANAPGGTYIAILFHESLPPVETADIKKMLAPVLDFQKTSPTQNLLDSLPPEQKKAVQEKRVIVGMDRDAVLLAVGKPRMKSRETTADGVDTESWVYGDPPGKMTFVTFAGYKVIAVKEDYADLGGSTAPPLPVQQ